MTTSCMPPDNHTPASHSDVDLHQSCNHKAEPSEGHPCHHALEGSAVEGVYVFRCVVCVFRCVVCVCVCVCVCGVCGVHMYVVSLCVCAPL